MMANGRTFSPEEIAEDAARRRRRDELEWIAAKAADFVPHVLPAMAAALDLSTVRAERVDIATRAIGIAAAMAARSAAEKLLQMHRGARDALD